MSSLASVSWGVAALVAALLYFNSKKSSKHPLPPGPKKRFLVGNLLDLPTSFEWETYARWSKEYGSDILHLSAAGMNLIVVNSTKVANDLFGERSANYSSRPQFPMTNELLGWGWLLSAMPYGEPWKERRRMFQQHFPAEDLLHQVREVEFIRRFLLLALNSPDSLLDLARHTIGGIALSLAFGIPIKPLDDPYINLAHKAIAGINESAVPGAFLVDFFPLLKYVPEWVPGAGFQKKAREWRNLQEEFHNKPYYDTLNNIKNGVAQPSFVSLALDSLDESTGTKEHQHLVIKDTAGMFFGGGAETTVTALETLVLLLLLHPEVQKKIQEELDRVVGHDRLPDFKDQDDMPYLMAVIKESVRWSPVLPIAVPHEATEDDIYNGYYIPKGSIVVGNVWAMLHDERDYPNPSEFNPERFLKNGKLNPEIADPFNVFFGFGRRECPGKHVGLATLWLITASILSVFDITKPVDKNGAVVEPSGGYHSALICHPIPYKTLLKPRSREAEQLVRTINEAAA
ncbi:cytochrome P450 [Cyathus striatus]|nr:cytochrome P450 [Cyathus striatus]